MKVPTAFDSGLGQILPDSTPAKQQALTVPGRAFGGARPAALDSLARGIRGMGGIVEAEERKSQAEGARQALEEAIRAERERAEEIAGEQAEEELENSIAQGLNELPHGNDQEAAHKFQQLGETLPGYAINALGKLSANERGKLEPLFTARIEAAQGQLAGQRKLHAKAGAQAARQAKLKRALDNAVAAKGDARTMGAGLALIDDVVSRQARDQGLTSEAEDALQQAEEEKLYGGVFDSLLQSGEAVTAEQFFFNAPDHIWDAKARQEKEDLLRPALTRENVSDSVAAILQTAPDPDDALKQAKQIKNPEVKAQVIETLDARKVVEARAKFDARVRGFSDIYTAISDAGGDPAAVPEALWQQLDGKDGNGKSGAEAKVARKLAKQIREGAPLETDWRLYHNLTNLSPKELANLPIWDHADKLNCAEFTLLAERQQNIRAALASGAAVTNAGAPGSIDAQLAALAKSKGWGVEVHAETRGLFEREIRAEIAEAVDANGGKPLSIAKCNSLRKRLAHVRRRSTHVSRPRLH